MKKILFLLIAGLALVSCNQKSTEDSSSNSYEVIEGEFIYLVDAAIIKGDSFIYGVALDDKMRELATIVKPLQRDEYDMVPVVIKGIINPKPTNEEGWDFIVTIKEIVEVKAPTADTSIKLEAGDKLKTEGGSIKVESGK
ncbi:hypothetical protein JM84_0163 [Dokdonia sp. Hel_I_63]|uniref:hypothetical protein n=1 Tax=unclassified Dokdonia TaxID=2615033 RepID=UPI00020A649B|nr:MULTISPECIES: hypothetical protein [unclassified Dokdonia]AEE19476.1 hypothetical protein Krodi_1493 [Dokdonia sp. 4H-3-7-5]TVZ21295.1 hypothetical protein JM84_0163 [Dokdonia sp. Hel_I_63]